MKKSIISLFLILFITSNIFSTDEYEELLPEPYTEGEFSESMHKLRRAEIIFAGSYPFSLLFTKIGFDFADYASSGFSSSKAPAIFGGEAQDSPSNDETKKILITALYVSAAFTLADYLIGEIKGKKAEDRALIQKQLSE